jgi:hypothetical protein
MRGFLETAEGWWVNIVAFFAWIFGAATLIFVTLATYVGVYWTWDRWNSPVRRWHRVLRVVAFYFLLSMGTVAFLGANEWWAQRVITILPMSFLKTTIGFAILVYAFINVYRGARNAYARRAAPPRTRRENITSYLRFLGAVICWVGIFLIVGKWWLITVGLWK